MNDDIELLRRYVVAGTGDAFAELVRRHIAFVYGAALRQTNGAHRAEDVTQIVFADLARKAESLCGRKELLGWLYLSTRNAARALVRGEVRREAREKEAHTMHQQTTDDEAPVEWAALHPMLDDALHDLADADRTAILRRFYCQQSLAEVGRALGVSEDAARKRLDRALDKLHALLARRGVTSTASALALTLAQQPIVAAPARLVQKVSNAALANVPIAGAEAAPAGTIGHASVSKMMMGVAGVIVAAAIGMALVTQHRTERREEAASDFRPEPERSEQGGGPPAQVTLPSLRENVRAPVAANPNTDEATRYAKAVETNLREIAKARIQFTLENGRWPTSLADLVGPDKGIKRLESVAGENYYTIAMTGHPYQPLQLVGPNGLAVRYDPEADPIANDVGSGSASRGEELMRRAGGVLEHLDPSLRNKAARVYRTAHGGQRPPSPRAIVPYFESAKDGADYLEYVELWEAARALQTDERVNVGKK
jgi:RNA polymerase sigma factor (sigma-70 family)